MIIDAIVDGVEEYDDHYVLRHDGMSLRCPKVTDLPRPKVGDPIMIVKDAGIGQIRDVYVNGLLYVSY